MANIQRKKNNEGHRVWQKRRLLGGRPAQQIAGKDSVEMIRL